MKRSLGLFAALSCLLALGPPTDPPADPPAPSTEPPLPHPGQHGSTIVADAGGAWVIERSVGALVRVDREGRPHARLELHPGLGELIRDDASGELYVADRAADRVVRIRPGADDDAAPKIIGKFAIRDPHGLALTPAGDTLLVTSVADRELVALETETLEARWRVELGAEPRPVAVAPDGSSAMVGFASLASVVEMDLRREGRTIAWHTLDNREDHEANDKDWNDWNDWSDWKSSARKQLGSRSRYQVPTEISRERASNVFTLGYVRGDVVVPHQVATPQLAADIRQLEHVLTRASGESSTIPLHQPRALAYDAERSVVYVGGYGNDKIFALGDWLGHWQALLPAGCGLDGLAVDPGGSVWGHCELSRSVVRIDVTVARHFELAVPKPAPVERWLIGPETVASARTPEIERGAELFRRGSGREVACSSCHPEARSDSLTWRYGEELIQTPILAGRMSDMHPHGWQRHDGNVQAAISRGARVLRSTPGLKPADLQALQAYLVSLPAPRPPSGDDQAIARGKQSFVELGCRDCHADEQLASDRGPSLIGLAHSAPYLHDGSAIDLRTLLTGRGSVPHTDQSAKLPAAALADLVAYLESL